MNLAIFHYHLNRGGVTQVILNHLRSLEACLQEKKPIKVAIFYGGRKQAWPDEISDKLQALEIQLVAIPLLDYHEPDECPPVRLIQEVHNRLQALDFQQEETLLHIHNHSLGKNAAWPLMVQALAKGGYATLLQMHDFAEDYRPENYHRLTIGLTTDSTKPFHQQLYPQAPQIHYSVLNGRDGNYLKDSGFPLERLHQLPNPALPIDNLPSRKYARKKLKALFDIPEDASFLLYPVRGIRRKNLGEWLLWSLLSPENCWLGLTLAPLNPVEIPHYERWKNWAEEHNLRCAFETGGEEKLTFGENLVASDALLTTSLVEGFGMVFLEAWLAARPLIGRDLPAITQDFKQAGLQLDALADHVWIPIEWLGKENFQSMLISYLRPVLEAYQQPSSENNQTKEIEKLIKNHCIDFGKLDSQWQEKILEKLFHEPEARETLLTLNPHISAGFSLAQMKPTALIEANKQVVQSHYSMQASGERLLTIYQKVMSSKKSTHFEETDAGKDLLNCFLSIEALYPVRLEN
ncbi:Glycosyl transferase group 1 [Planctomycetales bacterium 10988]|nr:Glycosyl transferase group 1 [Planctomycetales bacterium 10988]